MTILYGLIEENNLERKKISQDDMDHLSDVIMNYKLINVIRFQFKYKATINFLFKSKLSISSGVYINTFVPKKLCRALSIESTRCKCNFHF